MQRTVPSAQCVRRVGRQTGKLLQCKQSTSRWTVNDRRETRSAPMAEELAPATAKLPVQPASKGGRHDCLDYVLAASRNVINLVKSQSLHADPAMQFLRSEC